MKKRNFARKTNLMFKSIPSCFVRVSLFVLYILIRLSNISFYHLSLSFKNDLTYSHSFSLLINSSSFIFFGFIFHTVISIVCFSVLFKCSIGSQVRNKSKSFVFLMEYAILACSSFKSSAMLSMYPYHNHDSLISAFSSE